MKILSYGTRAADADRNAAIDVLANAFADGQLSQPEYEQRAAVALQAPSLTELRMLTRDLQTQPVGESGLPPTHVEQRGRVTTSVVTRGVVWLLRLLSVAAVVFLVLFGRWLFGGEDEPSTADAPPVTSESSDDFPPLALPGPPRLLTAEGLAAMVDTVRRETGSTTVTSLHLQADYATFDMSRAGVRGTYHYYFDGFLDPPTFSETPIVQGPPIDLADIDGEAMQRSMASLPRRVGVTGVTTSYVTLQYAGKSPRLRLYVSSDEKAGWAVTGLGGEILEVHRP